MRLLTFQGSGLNCQRPSRCSSDRDDERHAGNQRRFWRSKNSDLPIFASMTFDENQRTLTGASPLTGHHPEGLGVDCLGVNCSRAWRNEPIVMKFCRLPRFLSSSNPMPVFRSMRTIRRHTMCRWRFAKYIKRLSRCRCQLLWLLRNDAGVHRQCLAY